MKRFFFLLMFFCLFVTTSVYAGFSTDTETGSDITVVLPTVDFEILSGIDVLKDSFSTLDSTLTISGRAEDGSTIKIILWSKDMDVEGNLIPLTEYVVEVGAVALFSQVVDLKIGENNFTLFVEKEQRSGIVFDFVVRRKQQIVRTVLEKGVALPGSVIKVPIVLTGLPEVTSD